MSKKLTALQAYQVMLRCFDTIYFQTYDDDLGSMMSGAALYNIDSIPQTMDPAVWNDWMKGIKIILNDQSISLDAVELTVDQAYAAAGQNLISYCDIGFFESIGTLRDLMIDNAQQSELSVWLKNKWLQSSYMILEGKGFYQLDHFVTQETELTLKESFIILQVFLDLLCQKTQNAELIDLIQNSRIRDNTWQNNIPDIINKEIWDTWVQATNEELKSIINGKLNVETAFHSIFIFLKVYFENKNSFVNDFIQEKESNESFKVSCYDLWMKSINLVQAKQIENDFNLISINTVLSKDSSVKIINAWFMKYQLPQPTLELINCLIDTIQEYERSYLLENDQITVLELYYIMTLILKKVSEIQNSEYLQQKLQDFAVNKDGKPMNFLILLEWLYTVDQFFDIKY
jgi:hypothetical protein